MDDPIPQPPGKTKRIYGHASRGRGDGLFSRCAAAATGMSATPMLGQESGLFAGKVPVGFW